MSNDKNALNEISQMMIDTVDIFNRSPYIGYEPAIDRLDKIIRCAINLQEDAAEVEGMATRLKRIIRRDYDQLLEDIEKEEKAKKCETR